MLRFSEFNKQFKRIGPLYWHLRDLHARISILLQRTFDRPTKHKPRILFYNIMGLGYSGTDKFLQVIAKNLPKNAYDVYFMYGDKQVAGAGVEDVTSRLGYLLEGKVFPIRFDYTKKAHSQPYVIKGASPDVFTVIKNFDIDLVVTAGAGNPEYPIAGIRNVPIILINIFGHPNLQKNIVYHICISQEVADHLKGIVPDKKIKVMYVPSEGPFSDSVRYGRQLRNELGIPDGDIVFGRIGRNTDGIFDPIGIRAFQKVVKKYPNVHYLIISPAPALQKIIADEKIPNIHHTPPSGDEKKMWGFYEAMDVLAHFRKDGESFGLNIAEAMFCGKPIISHRSHQWNAHLEYLEPSFSFVAEPDNVDQYAGFMEQFARDTKKELIKVMGEAARKVAYEKFHISKHIGDFEAYVKKSMSKQ